LGLYSSVKKKNVISINVEKYALKTIQAIQAGKNSTSHQENILKHIFIKEN